MSDIKISFESKELIKSCLHFLIDTLDYGLDDKETNDVQRVRAKKMIDYLNEKERVDNLS